MIFVEDYGVNIGGNLESDFGDDFGDESSMIDTFLPDLRDFAYNNWQFGQHFAALHG